MEFIGSVEEELPLGEGDLVLVPANANGTFVHIDKLPEIVLLSGEDKAGAKLMVMDGDDPGDADQILGLGFDILLHTVTSFWRK